MISFDLGLLERRAACWTAVRLCALAESLGGVETLISHPGDHDPRLGTRRPSAALGIADGLVRISVGIEDAEDLSGTTWRRRWASSAGCDPAGVRADNPSPGRGMPTAAPLSSRYASCR